MNPIKKHFARFSKDTKGLAAIEFALTAPILVMLFLGGFEFTRNTIYQMKLEKMAFTIADVTSQNESLTNAQVNDIFEAADQIMLPADFTADGTAYITSVYRAAGSMYPTVMWQRNGGGTANNASEVGTPGLTATLPNNLTINERDNVIVVEVYYTYTATFTLPGINSGTSNFRKTMVFKPRLGALTTSPT